MYDNLAENSVLPDPILSKIPSSEVCKKAYHVRPPHQRLCSPFLPSLRPPHPCVPLCASLPVYFQVNLAFLCVQYGILAVAVLLLVVCTYAYVCTAPALPRRRPLKHAWLHPFFALLTFGANLTMLVSKEIVADTAVKVGNTNTSY